MTANLVVADPDRTEKTICLAVSPSLKAYGISGRPRLFEVAEKIREINAVRRKKAPGGRFAGSSFHDPDLKKYPELEMSYITAVPRMAYYMEYSTRIYDIYLKYIAPEDIHVYSIDEVFIDATDYLKTYQMTAAQLAGEMIRDVLQRTGITAAAGIGTNLYLCKVAMDIVAKHAVPDKNGVRIAELDEMSYRKLLWAHQPLTDFWRVGRGYERKLRAHGIYTMGDIARCSLGKPGEYYNEELLYRLFGVNAELLIDHAWGWEPCTIEDIRNYRPEKHSMGSGQVLQCAYSFEKARLVVREMTDLLVQDLVDKKMVTDQMTLTIGYDIDNLRDSQHTRDYEGEVAIDRYGRRVPKHAHGTVNLEGKTSSVSVIINAVSELFDKITDRNLLIRRLYVTAQRVMPEEEVQKEKVFEQLELFTDYSEAERKKKAEEERLKKERKLQEAVLDIKKRFGKNAVLKGMNLEEGATAKERNRQIGGHKA